MKLSTPMIRALVYMRQYRRHTESRGTVRALHRRALVTSPCPYSCELTFAGERFVDGYLAGRADQDALRPFVPKGGAA